METEQKYRPAPPGFTPEQWETFNEDGIIFIEDAIFDEDIDSYIDVIDALLPATRNINQAAISDWRTLSNATKFLQV